MPAPSDTASGVTVWGSGTASPQVSDAPEGCREVDESPALGSGIDTHYYRMTSQILGRGEFRFNAEVPHPSGDVSPWAGEFVPAANITLSTSSTQEMTINLENSVSYDMVTGCPVDIQYACNNRISSINRVMNLVREPDDVVSSQFEEIRNEMNAFVGEAPTPMILLSLGQIYTKVCNVVRSWALRTSDLTTRLSVPDDPEMPEGMQHSMQRIIDIERQRQVERRLEEIMNSTSIEFTTYVSSGMTGFHFHQRSAEEIEADRVEDELRRTQREKEMARRARLQKAINKPDHRSKLFAPVGFEYTFHTAKKYESQMIGPLFSIARRIERELERLPGHKYGMRAYKDGPVVEICTPVHKSKSNMLFWYDRIDEMRRKRNLRTFSRTSGGGGLHMNYAIRRDVEWGLLGYINLFTLIANNPEINWAFNEPSDNKTANCLWGDEEFINLRETEEDKYMLRIGCKSHAVNVKDEHHYELRMFEMVRSRRDLVDVVDFVEALHKRAFKAAMYGIKFPRELFPLDGYQEKFKDIEVCDGGLTAAIAARGKHAVRNFNALLRDLGLEPKRYRRFVERNLKVRRKFYGEEYLK